MDSGVTIYGLWSPRDGHRKIRYIGQTTQSLAKRLDSHIHCPKPARRRHLYHWIKACRDGGYPIEILALRTNAIWHETEIEAIACARAFGWDLVNIAPGGQGNAGPRTEAFKKILSEARKGMKFSESHKLNMSRCRIGIPLSEEAKLKVSATLKGRMPKNIELLHCSVRGKPKSEEHKIKLRESRLRFESNRRANDLVQK
jgi:hypothetical protein